MPFQRTNAGTAAAVRSLHDSIAEAGKVCDASGVLERSLSKYKGAQVSKCLRWLQCNVCDCEPAMTWLAVMKLVLCSEL